MSETQTAEPGSPRNSQSRAPTSKHQSGQMVPDSLSKAGSQSSHLNFGERRNFCYQINKGTYSMMRVYINSIYSAQVKLYYTKYTPKIKQGTICIIHGYGQNTDEFLKTAEYFALNNFVVNMVDLRGFGYSGGSRVNSSIKATVSDIQTLLRFCCELNLPTYIMAHGLGAAMVFSLLQQNPSLPISGVIALSPLLDFPNINRNSVLHSIILNLSPTIFDDVLINNLINPTSLTKDPEEIKKKIIGVFSYQYVSLKMAHLYDSLTYKVRKDSFKYMYPLLICHGGQDSIQPFSTVKKFYQQISSIDKELKVIAEGYHQLHNDCEALQVNEYVLKWITESPKSYKRNSTRWSKTKSFNLDTLTKQYHWKKILFLILLCLVGLFKILKRYIRIKDFPYFSLFKYIL